MTEYIYVCPNCINCLFAIPAGLHDKNQVLECQSCGNDINLWETNADVRTDAWDPDEYGISDAYVLSREVTGR